MEEIPPGLRYELKMEVSRDQYAQALSWVRTNSAAFRPAYPPRWVNNLYFDTYGLDAYNDHISGASERNKLRFRWYGQDAWFARGQIELKHKRGRTGWKQTRPVSEVFNLRDCTWLEFHQALLNCTSQPPDALFHELLRVSQPQIAIRYQRDYFLSADGQIRVTLDRDIHSYDQRFSTRPNLRFLQLQTEMMLIEFKCPVVSVRHLADTLREFPVRVVRHSKYVAALDSALTR